MHIRVSAAIAEFEDRRMQARQESSRSYEPSLTSKNFKWERNNGWNMIIGNKSFVTQVRASRMLPTYLVF